MKQLFLADLDEMTDAQLRAHLVESWEAADLDRFDIVVAYESVGSFGCDSTGWFLLRERETGALYEVSGGHCSCHGFEGQWSPQVSSVTYLRSPQFHFSTGGYDSSSDDNERAVTAFIEEYL